ncbi:toprim domain-containing protein, partial [Candidatus Babeliales bacterium]|nr:toprim domain-containing protein [Candidatus Babeliales bacterium]
MSSVVIGKEACPSCRSAGHDRAGDNLVMYDDGGMFCHARCGLVTGSDGHEEREIMTGGMIDGFCKAIPNRGISLETCEKYGYKVNQEKQLHIANFYDAAGNTVMQKTRDANKDFRVLGDSKYMKTFYGQWLFNPHEKLRITITEGELDALSIAEVFNCKYPVVSIPSGAKGAKAAILANKAYLEKFDFVVLAFDNDEAGRSATDECVKLFSPGKVRVVNFGKYKDANEMLVAGARRDLISAVYEAKAWLPPAVKTGSDLTELLDKHITRTKPWPWAKANKVMQEMRIPAVYSIAAESKVGKTT